MCTTTSTPTTPTNVKSSEPCEKEGSAVVPTAVTGATVEEEEGTQDAVKTAARAKGDAIDLARIAGKTRLARETGGISLARGLEGSASRGSPARQRRPPTAAAAAKEKRGPPSG